MSANLRGAPGAPAPPARTLTVGTVQGGRRRVDPMRALGSVAAGPLAGFLHARRWFGAKGREIRGLTVRDCATLSEGDGAQPAYVVALVDVTIAPLAGEGDAETTELYDIPLVLGTGGEGGPDSVIGVAEVDGVSVTVADALQDPRFARQILGAIVRRTSLATLRGGVLKGTSAAAHEIDDLTIESLTAAPLGAEQSNSSVVLTTPARQKLVVKVYRRLEEGMSVEVEMGEALSRLGFYAVPAMVGDLSYQLDRAGGGGTVLTLAFAQEFVEGATDGWVDALADLGARVSLRKLPVAPPLADYEVVARSLGTVTADLHIALASIATDPSFAPEPITRADCDELATHALAHLAETLVTLQSAARAWGSEMRALAREVAACAPALEERLRRGAGALEGGLRSRIHGDYHLGQVLRAYAPSRPIAPASVGGPADGARDRGAHSVDWFIVDFEGEPARALGDRRVKSSPLRDVAGMLRSYDYAAFSIVKERAEGSASADDRAEIVRRVRAWRDAARQAFLGAYLLRRQSADLAIAGPTEGNPSEIVAWFELEKALYELSYELGNRPEWVSIPLQGIRDLCP